MILLDGATGTELIAKGVSPCSLQDGTIVLRQPEAVRKIHLDYLHSGVDIISTCTFMAQDSETAVAINRAAVDTARRAIAEYRAESHSDRQILIAGSIGPTSGKHSYDISPEIYIAQMTALIQSGVNALLIETIVDPRYCNAAIIAARDAMMRSRMTVKVMLSASVTDSRGLLPCGVAAKDMLTDAVTLCDSLVINLPHGKKPFPLFSVGLNCSAGPASITEPLRRIHAAIKKQDIMISAHPNAGFPAADGRYSLSPEQFAAEMAELAHRVPIGIAGGCCGTTPRHILMTRAKLQQTTDFEYT